VTREAHICRAILKSFAKVFERIRKKRLGVFEATRPVSPRSNSAGKRTESSTFEVDPCVWIVIEQPGIGWEWGRVGALGWGCRGVRRGQCSRRFSKEMPPKHWQPPTGRQPTEAAAAQQPSADPQYRINISNGERGRWQHACAGVRFIGVGELKGVGVVVFGGWLALATHRPQLAHTPARAWKHGSPSPRAPPRPQSTYLRPRRACQVHRGAAMARVGARTKVGGGGWRLFFEITHWGTSVPYQWYPRSGSHCTQAVRLEFSL
jgi:hypothetical protein